MPESVKHLTDFPDRYSPMLVKELRQGMRAKTFIALFLSLQGFLAVMLFSAAANMRSGEVGSAISTIIFVFFAIAVLLVQPLRGTGALSSEVKGNTIDMMVLTRLSAWRIVYGKWIAIVGQTALLFVTIIPYLILRYFFGGMNLVGEMVFLLLMFMTSMALTAMTVGLSGCDSVIIRSLIPVLSIPAGLWALIVFIFEFSRFRGSPFDTFTLATPEARYGVAAYAACISYLDWSMLSLGTSLIAPAAENHALPRRLVALGLMLLMGVIAVFRLIDPDLFVTFVLVVAAPSVVVSLNDSSPLISTVSHPFERRDPVIRFLGNFLYPTWWSGVLFSLGFAALLLLVLTLGLAEISWLEPFRSVRRYYGGWDSEMLIWVLSVTGAFFFPALWQMIFFKGEGQRIANYLLVLVGSGLFASVLGILADSMNSEGFVWLFAFSPLNFTVICENANGTDHELILGAVFIVDLLIACTLIVGALRMRRREAMKHGQPIPGINAESP